MAKAKSGSDHVERNQARVWAQTLAQLAAEVMQQQRPADRVLGAHFRQHKHFGSRDRRFISETFFSFWRWWGWLRRLPAADASPWEAPERPAWARLLFLAHLLDAEKVHPVAARWKTHAGIRAYVDPLGPLELRDKARALAELLDVAPPPPAALVPDWLAPTVPLKREEWPRLVAHLQRRPPLWLRLQHPDRAAVCRELEEAGLAPQPHAHVPEAVAIHNPRVNLYDVPAYREGRVEVQDLASQAIGLCCGARPGERWWDACAGAGGKALQLGAAMANRGHVLATDIREGKLQDLKRRARRAQLHNIHGKGWDGRRLPAKPASFDGVLVDAPCTCSGTWRRNPDGRGITGPGELLELGRMQQQILDNVVPALKPGGLLVYATCSLSRDENEEVVSAFLGKHPASQAEPGDHPLTGEGGSGVLRVWPWQGDCDAVCIARLRHCP